MYIRTSDKSELSAVILELFLIFPVSVHVPCELVTFSIPDDLIRLQAQPKFRISPLSETVRKICCSVYINILTLCHKGC